ncbi:MAG TPA: glycosyl hydrolase family 18 protein [Candidatus Sulfotelmatobacter sp.]|nr:glycosyl hydrolase family 18 protein [Candidatus Sulfotelmatobacter sp.]
MRDKYINLIKEYIRVKPEYKQTLDDLKKEVLTIGATEEEFEEAIKQVENSLPRNENINPSEEFIVENTVQPATKNPKLDRVKKLVDFTRLNLGNRKKYVAVLAFCLILLIAASQAIKSEKPKNVSGYKAPKVNIAIPKTDAIPIVYASTQSVDPDKIFSIKSNKVQLTITGKPKKEVLGFFPYWMLPKYDKINLDALTSMSLFGLETDANGNIITKNQNDEIVGGWNMWNDPTLNKLIQKAKINDIKVYLTIKSFDSKNIESISTSDTAQKNLITNTLYLVNSKNLDGVNIDFEYVGIPTQEIRDGFTRFITNLNIELKRQIPNAKLTIDTYLSSGSEKGLFNIGPLSQTIDAFVIMGYDMHTPLGKPGPVSAMGGDTNIVGYIQNYLEKVDASKLILAVPYYGYDWPNDAPTQNSGDVKILPYAEIANQSNSLNLSWDENSQTPYFTYKDSLGVSRIVHFDNVRSLGIKYDFINKKNLMGVGIWALGYDGENQDLEKLLIDKFINE